MVRNLKSNGHKKISDSQVLQMVLDGVYTVDTEQGAVYNNSGNKVATMCDHSGSVFVQLYHKGFRRTISLGLLVWMAATRSVPPNEYEVHHLDKCKSNCKFDNLVALHHLDHDKYHVFDDGVTIDRVPF